jgi:hypothetical protein
MSFMTCSAGALTGTDFCLIFAPSKGYDEPEILPSSIRSICLTGADAGQPNVEAGLNAEFKRVHGSTVQVARKSGVYLSEARVSCLWPAGGIQDNTVNRLLLMSSSEHHLASAPMALFVESNVPER